MPGIAAARAARSAADVGLTWRVVARQPIADGTAPLLWRWTMPDAEAERLRAERDAGAVQTITGRDAGGRVLYARRLRAAPAPDPEPAEARDPVLAAMDLLRLLAEDPLVRPSYRAAARRHLARLAPPAPRKTVAAGEDDGEEAGAP
ncbi:MAG: hypothetical protein ACP5NP_08140 [Acetobacteraceae bacterium]